MVISRKRSVHELLEHVIENGGTTHKYEVVPPSNTDLANDPRKRDALSYGHGKQWSGPNLDHLEALLWRWIIFLQHLT